MYGAFGKWELESNILSNFHMRALVGDLVGACGMAITFLASVDDFLPGYTLSLTISDIAS